MKRSLYCLLPILVLLASPLFYGCSTQISNESAEAQVEADRAAHPEDYEPSDTMSATADDEDDEE